MAAPSDNKSIHQMRIKAKAFVSQQTNQTIDELTSSQKGKSIDPSNFMCKFCNGTVEANSLKFVHEKFCIMLSQNPVTPKVDNNDAPKPPSDTKIAKKTKKETTKNPVSKGKISDSSTQNSSICTQGEIENEDRQIEEFARKLEQISKQPPMKFVNTGRRRRKLKPNVSKDWLNSLKKQIKQQSSVEKDDTQLDTLDSESVGAQSMKESRLKDISADHVTIKEPIS